MSEIVQNVIPNQREDRNVKFISDLSDELEKIAFEKNGINELSDIIPLDRMNAIKSLKKAGFIHTDLEQKELVFGKESIAKQLLITREMYMEMR